MSFAFGGGCRSHAEKIDSREGRKGWMWELMRSSTVGVGSWETPGILARWTKDMTTGRPRLNLIICRQNVHTESSWKNDKVLPVDGFEYRQSARWSGQNQMLSHPTLVM